METRMVLVEDFDEWDLEFVEVPFISRWSCTESCGNSSFEDWLHTPKCEADFDKWYEEVEANEYGC